MKSWLIAFAALFASEAMACPNFSGVYEFQKDASDKLIIQQQGCENISITFTWNKYTASLLTDGQPYEPQYDEKMNSKFNIPATDKSYRFDRANFTADRFVWNSFDGERAKCEGRYSFTSFDCKMFEHSLRYDADIKAYVWTQVGYYRSYDGSFGNDEFLLKKVN